MKQLTTVGASVDVRDIKGLFGAAELNGERNRYFWELDGQDMKKRAYQPSSASRVVKTYTLEEFVREAKRHGLHDIGEPEVGGEAHWYVTFTNGRHQHIDSTSQAKQFINSISL